jgi:hypothetical protein
MDVKFELVSDGLIDLLEKVKKAECQLIELKK